MTKPIHICHFIIIGLQLLCRWDFSWITFSSSTYRYTAYLCGHLLFLSLFQLRLPLFWISLYNILSLSVCVSVLCAFSTSVVMVCSPLLTSICWSVMTCVYSICAPIMSSTFVHLRVCLFVSLFCCLLFPFVRLCPSVAFVTLQNIRRHVCRRNRSEGHLIATQRIARALCFTTDRSLWFFSSSSTF